jgi:hypothetical protein
MTSPTPSAGNAPPSASTGRLTRGLRLAYRGDHLALIFIAVGAAGYAALWLSVHQSIRALGDADGFLGTLASLSVGLTIAALLWSVWKDWRWLHNEEADIVHLDRQFEQPADDPLTWQSRVKSVLANASGGARRSVNTLLDDRVWALLEAPGGRHRALNEAEFRASAHSRAAAVGSGARYVSGLLLLLTVLGTFIGIKSVLPDLAAALGQLTQTSGVTDPALLTRALGGITAAFGSNLNALLGSIALGVVSFGVSAGRQHTLARLEQVSAAYVYPLAVTRSREADLASAVTKLEIASENFGGIGNELATFGDAIKELGSSVAGSLDSTRKAIQTLLTQQRAQVADQSKQIVDKLEGKISDTAVAVQQATVLYGSIAGTLTDRADAMGAVAAEMARATDELRRTREQFGEYVDSATRTLDRRLEQVERSVGRQVELYERVETSLTALVRDAGQLATAVQEGERRRQERELAQEAALHALDHRVADVVGERLADAGQRLGATLGQLPTSVYEGTVAGVQALVPELARVLQPPPPVVVPEPTVSVVPAPSLDERLARDLVDVLRRLETHMARPSLPQRVQGSVGGLLDRLTGKSRQRTRAAGVVRVRYDAPAPTPIHVEPMPPETTSGVTADVAVMPPSTTPSASEATLTDGR